MLRILSRVPPANDGEDVRPNRIYFLAHKAALPGPVDAETDEVCVGAEEVYCVAGLKPEVDDVDRLGVLLEHRRYQFQAQRRQVEGATNPHAVRIDAQDVPKHPNRPFPLFCRRSPSGIPARPRRLSSWPVSLRLDACQATGQGDLPSPRIACHRAQGSRRAAYARDDSRDAAGLAIDDSPCPPVSPGFGP